MGRILDLIFPERAYRRERRAEEKASFDGIKKEIGGLHKLICGVAASRTRRDKENTELMMKLFDRINQLEDKLDSLKATIEAAGKSGAKSEGQAANPDSPTVRQILNEYVYGANGDE